MEPSYSQNRSLTFTPSLQEEAVSDRLALLLNGETINDPTFDILCDRLLKDFSTYSTSVPFGIWAPGLAITAPMTAVTELLLPLAEVRRGFRMLMRRVAHYPLGLEHSSLFTAPSWLQLLQGLPPSLSEVNPGRMLKRLAVDAAYRSQIMFALSIPAHNGESFDRYTQQMDFLRSWITSRYAGHEPINCLDIGCGSGETTWQLLFLLLEEGYRHPSVAGVSRTPLEVFAAAHAYFPHDLHRQLAYRRRINHCIELGLGKICFSVGDLLGSMPDHGTSYQIIICNGLVGGPALHDLQAIRQALSILTGKLAVGGMLAMADRFHGGWKALVPREIVEKMMKEVGLELIEVPQGIAGMRRANGCTVS